MLIFLETFLAGDNPILIDEPEMSMHIDWQTELVSAIRQLNPKAQLILATHSPEIMAEVADDKVFRLNYE
jgi:predicted ATP-dependent endonuclease of OLD family